MKSEAVFPVGDAEFDATYAEEAAMVDASELIAAALAESNMSKTALANALNVSKSEISARLAGERNITVRKLAATLHATGHRLELTATNLSGSKPRTVQRSAKWRSSGATESKRHGEDGHIRTTHDGEWLQTRKARS